MSRTVLSVGDHPELLWLRHAVLESAGFRIRTAIGENAAVNAIAESLYDILLVCYSLPQPTREMLADHFRERCPESRIVAITNKQLERPDYADDFVYGVEGPEALIEALNL